MITKYYSWQKGINLRSIQCWHSYLFFSISVSENTESAPRTPSQNSSVPPSSSKSEVLRKSKLSSALSTVRLKLDDLLWLTTGLHCKSKTKTIREEQFSHSKWFGFKYIPGKLGVRVSFQIHQWSPTVGLFDLVHPSFNFQILGFHFSCILRTEEDLTYGNLFKW